MKRTLGEKVEDWWDSMSLRAAVGIKVSSILFFTFFAGPTILTQAVQRDKINRIKNTYGIAEATANCNEIIRDIDNENIFVRLYSAGKYIAAKDYLIGLKKN